MIGLKLDLELKNGEKHTVDVSWGVAYRWQQTHPDNSLDELSNDFDPRLIGDLAWEAAKTAGLTTEPVHRWIDTVDSITPRSGKASTPAS